MVGPEERFVAFLKNLAESVGERDFANIAFRRAIRESVLVNPDRKILITAWIIQPMVELGLLERRAGGLFRLSPELLKAE